MADPRARQGAEGVEVPLEIDTASAHQQLSAVEARLARMQAQFGRVVPTELGSVSAGDGELSAGGTVAAPPRVYPGQPMPSSVGMDARAPHAVAAGTNPSAARLAMARIAQQAFRADPQRFDQTVSAVGTLTRGQEIAGTQAAMPGVQQMLERRTKLSNLSRIQGIRSAGNVGASLAGTTARSAAWARAMGVPLPRLMPLVRTFGPAAAALHAANSLGTVVNDQTLTGQRMDDMRRGGGAAWLGELGEQMLRETLFKPVEQGANFVTEGIRSAGDAVQSIGRTSQLFAGELLGAMGIDSAAHARSRRARQDEEDRLFNVRRAAARIRDQLAADPSGVISATRNLAQRLTDGGRFESLNETIRHLRPLVEQRAVLDELRRQGLQATADDLGRQG